MHVQIPQSYEQPSHGQAFGQMPSAPLPAADDRPVDVRDEIAFSSLQIAEHALFMSLGIVDPRLKQTGAALQKAWEQNRPRWAQMDGQQAAPEYRYLAAETRSYKTEVLDRLNRGEWLGWLFPSFVAHVRDEMDMWTARINGQLGARQELCTLIATMRDHALFARQLLDPSEAILIDAAAARAANLGQMHQGCVAATLPNLLVLSKQAGTDLDEYFTKSGIGTPRVKSIVHPVLAQHVAREGRRFVQIVDQMGASGVQI